MEIKFRWETVPTAVSDRQWGVRLETVPTAVSDRQWGVRLQAGPRGFLLSAAP